MDCDANYLCGKDSSEASPKSHLNTSQELVPRKDLQEYCGSKRGSGMILFSLFLEDHLLSRPNSLLEGFFDAWFREYEEQETNCRDKGCLDHFLYKSKDVYNPIEEPKEVKTSQISHQPRSTGDDRSHPTMNDRCFPIKKIENTTENRRKQIENKETETAGNKFKNLLQTAVKEYWNKNLPANGRLPLSSTVGPRHSKENLDRTLPWMVGLDLSHDSSTFRFRKEELGVRIGNKTPSNSSSIRLMFMMFLSDNDLRRIDFIFISRIQRGELDPFDVEPECTLRSAHRAFRFETVINNVIIAVEKTEEGQQDPPLINPLFVSPPPPPMAE
ncbi:hypothetical protein M9H77_21323 [Catharanthus roseus]|uniref:Uncharacterized protein n=1 Tax=Catharanthus roseus TaxID=4058 RepID=A0ACC0AP18_CATRO|nr:hypothetical protein M9H77_21323 [Catharanthus roseus]